MYKFHTKNLVQPPGCIPNILLVMKLTTLILITAVLHVSATSFAQKITLSKKNALLIKVFNDIRIQSGYDFVFTATLLKNAEPVTINVKNAELGDVLRTIFDGQPFDYSIEDKSVIVSSKEVSFLDNIKSALQIPVTVSGKVTDTTGTPLPGASIVNKTDGKAILTNNKGEFTLTAQRGDQIIVTFVGYQTYTFIVMNNLPFQNIALHVSSNKLTEVVVSTGYQTLSKERSAGSFAKPDLTILRNRTTSSNILQRLDGLVPGLTINNAPSSSQNPLLIRGLSTIGVTTSTGVYSGTNRNPLYVVDGIPLDDVSTVNPQDVADITVLRDATAASIWGARAANGVIIIVTKKGNSGERIKVEYDGYSNFQGRPDLNYFRTLNSQQFIQAAKEVFDPVAYPWANVSGYVGGRAAVPPHELILYNQYRGLISSEQAEGSLDSLASISNADQIKNLWYRNSLLMNHSVSLSGGTKNYSFYASGAYTDARSNRPGETNNSYKVNIRQDFSLGTRIKLNLITDLNNAVSSNKRNINVDNRFLPYQLFQDADGNNLSMSYMQQLSDDTRTDYQNRSQINLDYNPLDEYNYGYTKNKTLMSRNILGVSVKLIEGLRFEGTYGYINNNGSGEIYDDLKSYAVRSEIVQFTSAPTAGSTPVYYLPTNGGTYTLSRLSQRNWTMRNQLVYNKAWDQDKHQVTLLVGQEAQEQLFLTNGSTVRGYNTLLQTYGSVDYATLGTTGVASPVMANNSGRSTLVDNSFSQSQSQTRFTSYYANAGYTYSSRYTINGSLRFDKSNLFGLDQSAQNRPVYSIGGKWLMNDESFLKGISWLNLMAIRTTYGITGNSPSPGTAASYDILSAQKSNFLSGGSGLLISTAANPHLSWERTENINLGLDFEVMNGRLSGSLDVYRKNTTDLIGVLPTNSFTGYSSIIGNIGDMQNKGIELSLNTLNISRANFSWNTLFNIAYNKNQITKYNPLTAITSGATLINQGYREGYPAFAVFAYEYAGLDELGDPLIRLADGTVTKTPGITKPEDLKYMGTYQPVWSGGLSNVFAYKSWGLSFNTIFNLGHVMRRDVNLFYTGRLIQSYGDFTTGNINADFAERWKQEGDESFTSIPSYISSSSLSSGRRDVSYYTRGDINVVSASYIKMRDITLSYKLPNAILKKLSADQITLRAQLSNIMLWKANHYGIDPEYQNATTGIRTLIANQGTFSFGLNIKF